MRKAYTKPGLTRVNLVPSEMLTFGYVCKIAMFGAGPGGESGGCWGGRYVNCKIAGS